MDITEIAVHLWPCWMLGIVMIYLISISDHWDILKISFSGIGKFLKWMILIIAIRFIVFKLLAPPEMLNQVKFMISFIPWQASLGAFWEDAVHSLPLVLMGRMFDKTRWYRYLSLPLMILVMVSFGSGHMYQGALASVILSFYIPLTLRIGKKYGFGTVMICHILYDLITLLSLKWMVGM